MTNDYKQKLFDYITGQYNIENPKENEPMFEDKHVIDNHIAEFLESYFGEGISFITGYFQGKTSDDEYLNYNALYGRYKIGDVFTNFILILDNNMNPLKVLDTYDSGTSFREFVDLQVAEDGTLYGVDVDNFQYRFIMLNNIFLALNNNYFVKLRYSYNLKESSRWYQGIKIIRKMPNESKYVIGSESDNSYICSFLLEVNVGSENTLTRFYSSSTYSSIIPIMEDITIRSDENNTYIYMVVCSIHNNRVYLFSGNTGTENPTLTVNQFTPTGTLKFMVRPSEAKFMPDYSSVYVASSDSSHLYIDKIENLTINNIITKNIENFEESKLATKNKKLFVLFTRNEPVLGVDQYKINIGMVVNDKLYSNEIDGISTGEIFTDQFVFDVNTIYNLNKYLILDEFTFGNKVIIVDQIWNDNNYNGVPFQDFTSLIPHSTYFRDNNGIQFARNVLNNTYFNNIETSTVQIPNIFINDLSIIQNNLLGITNNKIIENNTNWQKNIYEELYVNFINQYRILDRNQEQQKIMPILNGYASNDIVTALQTPQERYDDVKLTKYRINYADNTTKIGYLSIVNSENMRIKYIINIIVNKEINSIDLISEDENTIYLIIKNNGKLELNKKYSIIQEMTIE